MEGQSRGGLKFKVIAKNSKWGKDFWHDLVGGPVETDLLVAPPGHSQEDAQALIEETHKTSHERGYPPSTNPTRIGSNLFDRCSFAPFLPYLDAAAAIRSG